MEAEQEDRKRKSMKPNTKKYENTRKEQKLYTLEKKKIRNESVDEFENCVCIYCLKSYNLSKKRQHWVQCLRCKRVCPMTSV